MSEDKQDSLKTTVDVVIDLVKSVENPYERAELVERLIFEIINFGMDNLYEALGVLEKVKSDYIHVCYDVANDQSDDDEEDEGEESVN